MCTGAEIGFAVQAIGTVTATAGSAAAVYGAVEGAQASQEAEAIRKKQIILQQQKEQRQVARQTQLDRARATNNATVQNAGEGSGVQGGYGQIQQTGGENLNTSQQNLDLGLDLFSANQDRAYAEGISAVGNGANNLGMSLIKSSPTLGQIGSDLFGRKKDGPGGWVTT